MREHRPLASLLASLIAAVTLATASEAAAADAHQADTPVIGCGPAGPRGIIARIKPGDCVMYSLGTGDAGYWSIRGISWTAWGGRVTPANGTSVGRQLDTGKVIRRPARVRATGLRRGCDGRLWYSRVRVTVGYGWATLRLATCPGPLPD